MVIARYSHPSVYCLMDLVDMACGHLVCFHHLLARVFLLSLIPAISYLMPGVLLVLIRKKLEQVTLLTSGNLERPKLLATLRCSQSRHIEPH